MSPVLPPCRRGGQAGRFRAVMRRRVGGDAQEERHGQRGNGADCSLVDDTAPNRRSAPRATSASAERTRASSPGTSEPEP
ncbi:hypothetical protein [Streptomyces viridosporus]|uniref:hypothetical protein n=1 Tax=Streptomyces viridosporus TaxID=67581 RepID=UPI00123CFC7A|nr:hypothetical protein [Streptomyces viridosporus]